MYNSPMTENSRQADICELKGPQPDWLEIKQLYKWLLCWLKRLHSHWLWAAAPNVLWAADTQTQILMTGNRLIISQSQLTPLHMQQIKSSTKTGLIHKSSYLASRAYLGSWAKVKLHFYTSAKTLASETEGELKVTGSAPADMIQGWYHNIWWLGLTISICLFYFTSC